MAPDICVFLGMIQTVGTNAEAGTNCQKSGAKFFIIYCRIVEEMRVYLEPKGGFSSRFWTEEVVFAIAFKLKQKVLCM